MFSAAMPSIEELRRKSWQPISALFFVALASVFWEVLYIFWFPVASTDASVMAVLLQFLGVLVIFMTIAKTDSHSSIKGPSSQGFDRRELPIGASQDQRSPCHSDEEQLTRAKPLYQAQSSLNRFNAAIHKAGSQGDMQTVNLQLRLMANAGIKPCVITYNNVLNGFATTENCDQAEKWIAKMAEDGIAPDVVSYTSVINACGKQSDKNLGAERAERWFDLMNAKGIKPNEYSFTAIINAWAKANDVKNAVRFLDKMDEAGVVGGVIHYTSVLDACARVGNTRVSAQIFDRMQAAGVKPNIYSYTAVARALAVNGDYQGIEKMQEENDFQPNEYFLCALIGAYGNSQTPNPTRAREALQAAMSRGVPVAGNQAIAKAMSALCRNCHAKAAQ